MKRIITATLFFLSLLGAALAQAPQVVTEASQLPAGANPITVSATGTTAATAATLAASTTRRTFICGFSARSNATAAVTGNLTIAGVTGTMNFTHWTAPTASGLGVTEATFYPCVPSSAVNTGIVITSPAAGTAGINSVAAWGYQQ